MPLGVRVNLGPVFKGTAELRALADDMQDDMVALVTAVQAQTEERARVGAPVFRGILANSIQSLPPSVRIGGGATPIQRVEGIVQTTTPYAIVMEEGRRPGGPRPPFEPIHRWVQLQARRGKLGLPDVGGRKGQRTGRGGKFRTSKKDRTAAAIRGLAFMIQRSIGEKGIRGRFFMKKAADFARAELATGMRSLRDQWTSRRG